MFLHFLGFGAEVNAFDRGLQEANKKNYPAAITAFEEVVKNEPNNISAIHNLGNSYYAVKQYGKSILLYERALKIAPDDAGLIKNIEAANRKLGTEMVWTSPFGTLETILYRVGPNTWVILSFFMSLVFALSLFLFLKRGVKFTLRYPFLLLSFLLLGLFLAAANESYNYLVKHRFGIVTAKKVPVLLNELGELSGTDLKEGTRVEIINQKKNHLEAKLADGKKILLQKDAVELF